MNDYLCRVAPWIVFVCPLTHLTSSSTPRGGRAGVGLSTARVQVSQEVLLMEKKRNPWTISMLVGMAVLAVGFITGSPMLLKVGWVVALVSAITVVLQAIAGERS